MERSRRIGTYLVLSGPVSEPSSHPNKFQAGSERPIRIGVIGAGTITQSVHLPALRRLHRRFDLRVVCDASPMRAAEIAAQEGVEAATDPQMVFERDDIDAVLIATPGTHGLLTEAALLQGLHVLVEKPLTLTVAEAKKLEQLSLELGLTLQVGYMKMCDPVVKLARREVSTLGTVRLVRVTVLHPSDAGQIGHLHLTPPPTDADPALLARMVEYEAELLQAAIGPALAADPLGGWYRDVLHGSVIHELSLLRALGAVLPEEFEHVAMWPWPRAAEPPCLLATAQLPAEQGSALGGALLSLSWNWLPDLPRYEEEVAIFGERGSVVLSMAPPYLVDARSTITVTRAADGDDVRIVTEPGPDASFVAQLATFADTASGGSSAAATASGAALDSRCLQRLVAQAAAGAGFAVTGEVGHDWNGQGQS
jgi:predicted dehydrogenase